MSAADTPDAVVDDVFSSLPRLKVAAFLAGCDEAEFKVISDSTDTAMSALSKAATHLEGIGYAHVRKGHVGRRSRTWLALTPTGRTAFSQHLAALQALTNRARTTTGIDAVNPGG
ncbi:ArsR family transcriptional regulator [Pseudoclavibacter sp. RFBJ3]|uniref:transcriptional regulator n=1 Tax=unclassified Pseudoclavibacter TaxID=2615177 RepID=UPI000CE76068|nr:MULTISPECIES: transcriptional regulator [unclassified Pseudoclavibacter]PPF79558.1 ArsR family transcriptional regulator [Pseudoclavibacter sp. RFBJ5]PPF88520.1 ArsR family transcriptional regulator [Pseudoclavibacter sp. RFBJ3]PPF94239.1 ArsR family transcriptional regulator [Pseudoclavibacter sp. RFBH5]PPG18230.1 ArsR family transcriptional regulator [Pseudoclavibacter sp. RFBI4]